MTDKEKLKSILNKVNEIFSLVQGNEYEKFLDSHLLSIQFEINRQISLTNSKN